MASNSKRPDYVSQRAISAVVGFLQRNAINERCSISVQDISDRLGYASTTVFRVLKRLQTDNIISIEHSKDPTQPNTIVYHGTPLRNDLFMQGLELCNRAVDAVSDLVRHVGGLNQTIDGLQKDLESYKDFSGRIEQTGDIGDNLQQVIVRKKPIE